MSPTPETSSPYAALLRKATEISSVAYSMAIPPGLGYLADRYFQSSPIGLTIGAVLGFLTGTLQLFRLAGMLTGQQKHRKSQSDSSDKQ